MFVTKRADKLSRSNTCCQLFATDKGFVYIIPMKSNIEVLQSITKFTKDIGAPDAIICDMAGYQTSKIISKFYNETSNTMQVLEEEPPWSNKA